MSKKQNLQDLQVRRAALTEQIKRLDDSIKIERLRERELKTKRLIDALAVRGLLDADPDELLARLAVPAQPTNAPTTEATPPVQEAEPDAFN